MKQNNNYNSIINIPNLSQLLTENNNKDDKVINNKKQSESGDDVISKEKKETGDKSKHTSSKVKDRVINNNIKVNCVKTSDDMDSCINSVINTEFIENAVANHIIVELMHYHNNQNIAEIQQSTQEYFSNYPNETAWAKANYNEVYVRYRNVLQNNNIYPDANNMEELLTRINFNINSNIEAYLYAVEFPFAALIDFLTDKDPNADNSYPFLMNEIVIKDDSYEFKDVSRYALKLSAIFKNYMERNNITEKKLEKELMNLGYKFVKYNDEYIFDVILN